MNHRLQVSELCWLRERLEGGLRLLAHAQRYGALESEKREQFAVKSRELADRGLSECDLTWLLSQSIVQHLVECTSAEDDERRFRTGGAGLGEKSCFLLTPQGCEFLGEFFCVEFSPRQPATLAIRPESVAMQPGKALPRWDNDRQELTFDGRLVKRYRLPSPNQTAILSAFAEEGWPPRIDDPLSPHVDQDPKRRLHDTIRNLNRAQVHVLLRFVGDGSGQGILWERAS
jgi:hypothetical protein